MVEANQEGVPQGGPLSALLSNIVLNELDWKLQERGHKFVRYADDCKIYVRSERAGHRVMEATRHFIVKRLRLSINESKSAVARPRERHFVGFRLEDKADGEVEIRLSERSVRRLARKVVELTPRNWGNSLVACIDRLNVYLQGWMGFFHIVGPGERRRLNHVDAHIRRRLRALQLKQWKRKRTILRKFTQLGAPRSTAGRNVYDQSLSWWALSKSWSSNKAMHNGYFFSKGLLSLGSLWNLKQPHITTSLQLVLKGIG
jgi:hypothetical protein